MKENNELQTVSAAVPAELPALNTLPDLSKGEAAPVELLGEYWTPMQVGETKRVFFYDIDENLNIDPQSGEYREQPTVRFLTQVDGDYRLIRNSSSRLVGIFQQLQNRIKPGDAFEIKYLGKKKNSTNAFSSDTWSVKQLFFNAA